MGNGDPNLSTVVSEREKRRGEGKREGERGKERKEDDIVP
jgi:hypothetical protein